MQHQLWHQPDPLPPPQSLRPPPNRNRGGGIPAVLELKLGERDWRTSNNIEPAIPTTWSNSHTIQHHTIWGARVQKGMHKVDHETILLPLYSHFLCQHLGRRGSLPLMRHLRGQLCLPTVCGGELAHTRGVERAWCGLRAYQGWSNKG